MSQLRDRKKDKHTTYCHSTSVVDMQQAISSVLEEDVITKMNINKKYSLMFEESTDVSIHQNLIMYIRISINGPPRDKFPFEKAFKKWVGQ